MNLVLLSGGSGQRLWPLSNDIRSKQFIKIFHREDGELESMVQRVYHQIKAVDADATVTIATSKSQVSTIHNQLGEGVGISVEPCRRDTFPAIALAAAYLKDVQGVGEEESVVVCPVDPYVENDYFEALKALGDRAAVSSANLVLMGIARIVVAYGDSLKEDVFKDHVGRVSVKAIIRAAKERRPGALGYSEAMIIEYNKKSKFRLSLKTLYGGKQTLDEDEFGEE